MKLSVLANLYGSKPLDEALKIISSLGVHSVEIGAGGYPGKDHCDPEKLLADPKALEEFKNSWIAKENTPCIFISAREKIGIDKLRGDLYKMVAEIHAGRYPFDNFLW